ncbi:MAG: isoprenylcysteine carboxylmethyltransferase family protein [Rhodanobacteraceae bacterium]|nr:isoprenylcysteine carboxylmethyltransferase family protein [Rhodanobacteraceae bacterium]
MKLQLFDVVFLLGFVTYVVIRGVFIERGRNTEVVVRCFDWRERVAMSVVFVGSMLLPLLYLFTPVLSLANYDMPTFVHVAGSVMMVAGLWLFWRSHADLGRNWSATLELKSTHSLVTVGVYRLVRHPMYGAIGLVSTAQGMLLDNWLAGWAALLSTILLCAWRIPREEQMMQEHFGLDYERYAGRTGRLFPKLPQIGIHRR